jgi:Domain of unknown function (DUF4389)
VTAVNDRPVQLIVSDDLQRSLPTLFFRLPLVIPHLIWLALWGVVAFLAVIANWFATLFAGVRRPALRGGAARLVRLARERALPLGMRNAGALVLRYGAQTNGYLLLLTDVSPYSGPTKRVPAAPASGLPAQPLSEPSV